MVDIKDRCKHQHPLGVCSFCRAEEQASSCNSELLAAAGKACIDIYTDLHVSEMRNKPEHLKQAWSIGQELYLKKVGS